MLERKAVDGVPEVDLVKLEEVAALRRHLVPEISV